MVFSFLPYVFVCGVLITAIRICSRCSHFFYLYLSMVFSLLPYVSVNGVLITAICISQRCSHYCHMYLSTVIPLLPYVFVNGILVTAICNCPWCSPRTLSTCPELSGRPNLIWVPRWLLGSKRNQRDIAHVSH